jgi:uncharacterized protein (DUF1697 family)
MNRYVALVRAVNVGGTGKLPMAELKAMGEACGFTNARTYIATGNLLFESAQNETDIKARLEKMLLAYAGKPVEVFVRTAAEIAATVAADPFPDANGSRHMVFFHNEIVTPELIASCRDINGERLAVISRELYVDYGDGIRFTKLKIPGKTERTGRNMNTVRKLAELLQR